jgi:hypothetical protein
MPIKKLQKSDIKRIKKHLESKKGYKQIAGLMDLNVSTIQRFISKQGYVRVQKLRKTKEEKTIYKNSKLKKKDILIIKNLMKENKWINEISKIMGIARDVVVKQLDRHGYIVVDTLRKKT